MPSVERDSGECPTCGQRVGTFTADDGTSHYLARAEQDASEVEFLRDVMAQARLYGEKMVRDRDDTVRACGADLLGILEGGGALLAPDLRALLERNQTPVVYWHDEDDGPPVVAIVDPSWLGDVWECAIRGGYVEPSVTDAGREAGFLPHEHTTPEDRAP